MAFGPEEIRRQLPAYLLSQKGAEHALQTLLGRASGQYYIPCSQDPYTSVMLQGDGWTRLQRFSVKEKMHVSVRGLVLSNSCDISPENQHDFPRRIMFSPIIRMSKFRKRLSRASFSNDQIDEKIKAIRSQKRSNALYLPEHSSLGDECVVFLDDIHSMPVERHREVPEKEKLFTLSMVGFYILVFKLSIHFCRLREGVERNA